MIKSLVALGMGCGLALGAEAPRGGALRPWPDYQTIMWVGDAARKQPDKLPLFLERLREMGINTAMVYGDSNPQPFLDNKFPYYVENVINKGLCLKWNSKVRDWDKIVTAWAKGGRPESAFVRDYCLDDPEWRGWARSEMQRVARRNAPRQPLAYDIRDELSTTISANPFDYDFNPIALAAFRTWLKSQYRDLPALNAQWETRFASWDEVRPFTTDQIKNRMASGDALPRGNPDWQAVQRLKFDPVAAGPQRTRWNLSPWCDFRTYMDISLAAALDDIRQASHGADPRTPVGIEGTQMPHPFGGYDLWRLARVLDWVEPYDIGNAREILGSFMPGQPIVCTLFEKDTPRASRRLWHLLLEGDRGCVVWWSEDCLDWNSPDYALTPKARALAPALKEMSSPLARLFLRAQKRHDPIAIHYSQPSIQVDWLIESTVDGSAWHRRFSSFEAEHNRMARVRNGWLKAFQDLGYSPRFLAAQELAEHGAADCRALVLPTSRAMSEAEARQVNSFLAAARETEPHVVLADGAPAMFDEHGRLLAQGRLAEAFPPALSEQQCSAVKGPGLRPGATRKGDIAACPRQRLAGQPNLEWAEWIAAQVQEILPREVSVPADSRTRIHRFQLGPARLLAFERNIDYHMSEDLKQAGGNEALEKPVELVAALAAPAHVYDLRTQGYLGQTDKIAFRLDPWQPSLFALLPQKLEAGKVVDWLEAR